MDIIGIIGLICGFILVCFGIVFNPSVPGFFVWANLSGFVDVAGVMITIGGTICALFVAFPFITFKKIPKHIKILLKPKQYDPHKYIEEITKFSKEARVNGLLALEDKLEAVEDTFLRNSLMLVVDSVDPEKVKVLMESELDYMEERHEQDRKFYEKGGSFAPAFGMIGTLIGLVNMLRNMGASSDGGSSAIGQGMAVALLTTFYGSMLANLFFLPVANKLRVRHEEEMLCKKIICEGVYSIQAGENPRFVKEKLTLLIPENQRLLNESQNENKKNKKSGTNKRKKIKQ